MSLELLHRQNSRTVSILKQDAEEHTNAAGASQLETLERKSWKTGQWAWRQSQRTQKLKQTHQLDQEWGAKVGRIIDRINCSSLVQAAPLGEGYHGSQSQIIPRLDSRGRSRQNSSTFNS
jgi:hypothetical protein